MTPIAFSSSDPLRRAAESFVARLRRGERPTLAEYAERLPDHADRIREIFPRLLAAERRVGDDQTTGPFGPVEDQSHVPKTIGDYVIVREIGRGGMGIVYEAMQASLGRQVALKVLPSGPCSRGPFLERFRREARAAARLHHTNIVPVYGVGEADNVHFYAMQYIEGMGLDAVLKEFRRRRGLAPSESASATKTVNIKTREDGGELQIDDFELGPASILPSVDGNAERDDVLPPPGKSLIDLAELSGPKYYRSIARLGVQAAEAVAYAHLQGVLHRDIKPSNFLLDRYGILWITDFGLAKAEGEDMTGTGDIVGTLRYMAPERFQAKSDSRSDVYALGMTLYEMIALRPAFEEDDRLKLVDRINRERPARLRNFDRDIPHDLETIILKAIQKVPEHRYESAADMADDLRRFLTDRPIKARRATILEELRRWCRRNPAITGLVGLVLMMWLLLVAVVVYANFQLRSERDEVVNQSKRAVSAQMFADDRRWHAEVTTAQLRRSLRQQGQRFAALDALGEARRIRIDPALTNHAIASLALPDIRRIHAWDGWPPGSIALDFDPNFERYARSERGGRVSIREIVGDVELLSLPGLAGPALPRFGRTEQYLAVWNERDGALRVWRLQSESEVLEEKTNAVCFDFSANDQFFASGHIDGSVTIYQLPDGKSLRTVELGSTPTVMAFHPREPKLAAAVGKEIVFIDSVSGDELARSPAPGTVNHIAWHPDGRHLAVATGDGQIANYRRMGEPPSFITTGHRGGISHLTFHPDGSALASAGLDNTIRLWNAMTGQLILAAPFRVGALRFSRDGRRLAAQLDGNRLALMETATGREYRSLTRQDSQRQSTFNDGAVSPDAQLLALATSDGVILWNLSNGEELVTLRIGGTTGCLFLNNDELITSGVGGVFAWSIRPGAVKGAMEIGPPRQLASGTTERLAGSHNGSVIAVAAKAQGAFTLNIDRPTIRNSLLSHEAATFVAVSPDGTYIATGTIEGTKVQIWDSLSSRLVRELPIESGSDVVFSPDGKWLATNLDGGGVQLWAVGVWNANNQDHKFPGAKQSRSAFSPDSRLLAVDTGTGSIRLYGVENGALIAELEDPNRDRATWLTFSPNGGRLIAACNDSQTVHVWDLSAIRDGLALRGLEGVVPTFDPPSPNSLSSVQSMTVVGEALVNPVLQARWSVAINTASLLARPTDANAYCRRGAAFSELGLNELSVQDLTRAIQLRPEHAESYYLRGNELFQLRRWSEALEDFRRAQLQLAPDRPALADSARWMRGKTLLKLDRVEEMLDEVNDLMTTYPNDPQLFYQRALGHAYRGRHAAAVSDLHLALKFGPTNDAALNNLAWILITGPADLRDVERGLGYAQRAVTLAPQKPAYQNTLGVALYRLNRFREALVALEKSFSASRNVRDGYDLYFQAMCHAQLGDTARARDCFERAKHWRQNTTLNPFESAELKSFEQEAEAAIGRVSTSNKKSD